MIEKYKQRGSFFANLSPSKDNWLQTGAGISGVVYSQIVMMDGIRIEVYIGTSDQETNKRFFDKLYEHKDSIEKLFGKTLDWQRLDEKTGCRICYSVKGKGLKNKEQWPELQDEIIDYMLLLRKAFHAEIEKLR